jgi:hypothetical protein
MKKAVVSIFAAVALLMPVAQAKGTFTVLTSKSAPRHELFVFLPGTGATPIEYHTILDEAAAHGFNVIGLPYDNKGTIGLACARSSDPNCWGNVRAPRAQDIESALSTELSELSSKNSAEWGAFVQGGTPVWSKIVLSGHSQGAGEAVWIAKEHAVARVCGFDSPSDGNRRVPVAAWLSNPSATPASAIFVATNTDDEISKIEYVEGNVRALGLPAENFVTKTIAGQGYLRGHAAIVSEPEYASVRAALCFE